MVAGVGVSYERAKDYPITSDRLLYGVILLVFMFVWVCFIGIPTDQAVYLDGIGVFFVAQVGMKPTKWGDMRSLLALGIIVYTVCI